MTIFVLAAVVMVLVALVLVLPPLLRTQAGGVSQRQVNIQIHRQRLAELEAERAAGSLAEADFQEARAEQERLLLEDVRPEAQVAVRPARAVALAVAVLVPVLGAGLYLQLGGYQFWRADAVAQRVPADTQSQLEFIRNHVDDLRRKVESEPDNAEAWLMLGRSYMVLDRPADAAAVLAQARDKLGDQPPLLAEQAEAVGYAQDGDLSGEPQALLQRALELDPQQPKALWLSGLAALQAQRPDQARTHWQTLLAILPPDGAAAVQVRSLLAELDGDQAAVGASVPVEVRLDPALAARLPENAVLFVIARVAGETGTPPVAVVRQPLGPLPLGVVLDESTAMAPGRSLAEFPQVTIEARISRHADARAASGDLFGRVGPVTAGEGEVTVVVDQVVP